MATLSIYAGEDFNIAAFDLGSGLGFYGDSGFGAVLTVGQWNGRTYITNAAGNVQGPEIDNVKYLDSASGILGQTGSGYALTAIPNYQATLKIRFEHTTPVQVFNPEFRVYDGSNVNNNPSGVTVAAAELIHPDLTQTDSGSGDTSWQFIAGSSATLSLAPSPGVSGFYAGNGSNSTRADTVHEWFVAVSVSPDSIGSKTQFAAYANLEYS